MELLKKLLANGAGSIKGQIDLTELVKAIGTALSGGSLIGVLIMALTAISASAATIFPNPLTATLATFAIGLVVDLLRRQASGQKPVPVQPGETVLAHGTFVPSDIDTSVVRPVNATKFPDDLMTGPAGVVR